MVLSYKIKIKNDESTERKEGKIFKKKTKEKKTCLFFYINVFLQWNSKEKHGNAMSYMWWQGEFAYVYTWRQKERVKEREMMMQRKKKGMKTEEKRK